MKKISKKSAVRIAKVNTALLSFVLLGVCSYIFFVYNTVLAASTIEASKSELQKTQVSLSEKEHAYIESVSDINIAYAEFAGYVSVPADQIAYIETSEETALAMR